MSACRSTSVMLALTLWLTACGGDRASSDSIALDPSTDDETIAEGTEPASATQRWPRPLDTLDPDAPAQWGVEVLDRFPHDARAFTQGLEALGDGTLLESTGLRGESTIRVVDPTTGIVLDRADLTDEEFGEGATVVDDGTDLGGCACGRHQFEITPEGQGKAGEWTRPGIVGD